MDAVFVWSEKHSHEHLQRMDASGRVIGYLWNVCQRADFPQESSECSRNESKRNLLLMLQPAVSVTTCIRCARAEIVTPKPFESVIVWDRNIRLLYNQIFISQTCLSCVHSGALILPKWSLFSLPEYWSTHVINTIMVWPYAFKACMHARLARIAVSHGVRPLCCERLSRGKAHPQPPQHTIFNRHHNQS